MSNGGRVTLRFLSCVGMWCTPRWSFVSVFFAIYIDSLVHIVKSLTIGCAIHSVNFSILLYADDILLLAPTATALKQLLIVCEVELKSLDMCINVNKSACIRVGPRYKSNCSNIITSDGQSFSWATSVRY